MVTIVTDIRSPRLDYVLDYIFSERLGIDYNIAFEQTADTPQPVISYKTETQAAITIEPRTYSEVRSVFNNIDFTTSQRTEQVPVIQGNVPNFISQVDATTIGQMPVIFPTNCNFGFDLFAAVFFMLARVEEYNDSTTLDQHGRFMASQSVALKNNWLHIPVVDVWIEKLKAELLAIDPTLQFKTEKFELAPSTDIDCPWCYLHKGFLRNIGGLCRDLLFLKLGAVANRILVLCRLKTDPHFTFSKILEMNNKHGIESHFFVLLAKYGKFDKSVNRNSKAMAKFLKKLSQQATVDLHPSYASYKGAFGIFGEEQQCFEQLVGKPATAIRQHYLLRNAPEYHWLENFGVTTDYTMAYASHAGFRAGTCHPFPFFDFANNRFTNITIHPLVLMDTTLSNYQQLSATDAKQQIANLLSEVKKVNGQFNFLWHNSTFANPQWANLYEQILNQQL